MDLSKHEQPFTGEEIDHVVANLPSDKSPGPDGFRLFIHTSLRNVGLS